MPRKAPDGQGVTEHRITLGDYERHLLKPYAENVLSKQKAESIQAWVRSGAMVGGVVVVFLGVRLISNTWSTIAGIVEPVMIFTGRETHEYSYVDPKTGEVTDSTTVTNSLAGVPILGGAVSFGYDVAHGMRGWKNNIKGWFS